MIHTPPAPQRNILIHCNTVNGRERATALRRHGGGDWQRLHAVGFALAKPQFVHVHMER